MIFLGMLLCLGLVAWGISQILNPEKAVRRKFPDAKTIPDLMLRNTRLRGGTCAAVGMAGVLYLLGTLLKLI